MTEREMVMSEDYVDIISDVTEPWEITYPKDSYFYQEVQGEFGIFYVDRNIVPPMSVSHYTYRAIPKLESLLQDGPSMGPSTVFDPTALSQSGILQIQRPPLSLTGSGVVIGFIDSGIRFTENVFRNADGSSRILSIWDQTIQTGQPPKGMVYGTEYTNDMINRALRTADPRQYVPSWDEIGHGTAVASVAAGSILNGGTTFQGAAPNCQIVMVKCKQAKQYLREYNFAPPDVPLYAETDIILAIRYLEEFAIAYRRPVVICVGVGNNLGGHSGGSPGLNYVDKASVRRSRILIASGGNEGNSAHHFSGSVRGDNNKNEYQNIEIQVKEGVDGFIGELWGSLPNALAVTVRSPGGETTQRVDFRTNESRRFTFIYENSELQVEHRQVEISMGIELFFFRFISPTPGVWTIRVESAFNMIGNRAPFNMWLPIFVEDRVVFLAPDPNITLTSPANTEEIVSVSTYNQNNGSFYGNSGRGYTRDNIINPDIAAPGVDVDTILGKMTGGSMAAAITSGAAAQFMQWAVVEGNNRHVESQEFRSYLIMGATRSNDLTYPNREWGYGKLNIAGTFNMLAGLS
ncbi:MAG: S8 family peptidase [Lachnospiraceae bacterium]|jgi:subtilisin family serine protease|nr:S8 family peptidase [Lachnospiraceae bacterium]